MVYKLRDSRIVYIRSHLDIMDMEYTYNTLIYISNNTTPYLTAFDVAKQYGKFYKELYDIERSKQ